MKYLLEKLDQYKYIMLGVCIGLIMVFLPYNVFLQNWSNVLIPFLSNITSFMIISGVLFCLIVKCIQVIESKIDQFERHLLSEIKYLIERNK